VTHLSLNGPLPAIDPAEIARFIEVVFGYLDHHVPVRMFSEKGTPYQAARNSFPSVSKASQHIAKLATDAARDQRGVFVVPGTVRQSISAKAEDIVQTGVLVVDLDSGDIAGKSAHLASHLGQPSLEIASGGVTDDGQTKRHLYWRLSEPSEGNDLEDVRRLREIIAVRTDGDTSFSSLHQPIRVPGTVHGKFGHPTLVRILTDTSVDHPLTDLAERVDAMPFFESALRLGDVNARQASGPTAKSLKTRLIRADNQDEISRFAALSKVIGHWLRNVRQGICSLNEAWEAIADHNAAMIQPPWDDVKLRHEFTALLRKDVANKGQMPRDDAGASGKETSLILPPSLSEDALAASFVVEHGSVWRHVPAWGAWLHWNGMRWGRDEPATINEVVRQVCRVAVDGHDKPGEARRVASEKTMRAVRAIAASDPAIATRTSDWDAQPMRLNTPDGIVDLETGEVSAPDPTLLLTQITGASSGKGCAMWMAFLGEITDGNADLQAYLARFCGYCLTGSTREQVFVFLHGSGANGKSVFLQTLAAVLGDYAATATLDTFMAARTERHLTELAGLRAARLVLVPETEAGRSWAEARIKAITGGEKVRANFMRQDHFEFLPQFKLVVAGNHRPTLSNVGEAMRRRLHLVPFSVTIPPERRDRHLQEKLLGERDGILSWMIAGCAEWQRIGLDPPAAVVDAAAAYFKDEDIIGHWIGEACETGPDRTATSKALFQGWSDWAKATGHAIGSAKALGEALNQHGFRSGKVGPARGWHGIALRRPGTERTA